MSFDWDKYHEYEVKYLKKSNDNDFLNMWEVNTLYEGEMFQKESYDFFFDFYYYIITQYSIICLTHTALFTKVLILL